MLAESNFAQIDGCDDADELRGVAAGGGVVAFYRRSRPLMFVYDTDSGTNGHLTPLELGRCRFECNQLISWVISGRHAS